MMGFVSWTYEAIVSGLISLSSLVQATFCKDIVASILGIF